MDTRHNLRTLLGVEDHYVHYCREERNFAAVLYHLLLDEACLARFLALIGQGEANADEVRIYFEYAHLRDLWAEVGKRYGNDRAARNARYRDAIVALLDAPFLPEVAGDCEAFNRFFIGDRPGAASKTHVQMPSRWNDDLFEAWESERDRNFAKRACTLKWAFNAKPDLVLDLGNDRIICIEAKLESRESRYKAGETTMFGMSQTRLQEYIFRNLLGYQDPTFIMISKGSDGAPEGWRNLTWSAVYGALLAGEPGRSQTVRDFIDDKRFA
jgi:hypothetical protein